mgnify:CR=1 FL=1
MAKEEESARQTDILYVQKVVAHFICIINKMSQDFLDIQPKQENTELAGNIYFICAYF